MPLLLCTPTTQPAYTAGCITGECSICGTAVWISREGVRAMQDTEDLRPACVTCGMAVASTDDEARYAAAPGSLDVVEAVYGTKGRQQAVEGLERLNRAQRRANQRRNRHRN